MTAHNRVDVPGVSRQHTSVVQASVEYGASKLQDLLALFCVLERVMQHRRLSKQELPTVPISQFRVVEHKLGFKPIIACACGAVLDLNTAKVGASKAFYNEHALCPPKVERDELVTQITQENAGLSQE